MQKPAYHGRDHRGWDPATSQIIGSDAATLIVDSTDNVGTPQGVGSYGATTGHVLTADGAGGSAWQAAAAGGSFTYADYTPTLTASTSNPTLAVGSAIVARWTQIGKLVHYYGEMTLSGGLSVGTGRWRLSVPAHVPNSLDTGGWTSKPNGALGVANIYGQNAYGNMVAQSEVVGGGQTPLVFLTQDALPFGNAVYFGDAAGFTFADPGFSDIFIWSVVYETDG